MVLGQFWVKACHPVWAQLCLAPLQGLHLLGRGAIGLYPSLVNTDDHLPEASQGGLSCPLRCCLGSWLPHSPLALPAPPQGGSMHPTQPPPLQGLAPPLLTQKSADLAWPPDVGYERPSPPSSTWGVSHLPLNQLSW